MKRESPSVVTVHHVYNSVALLAAGAAAGAIGGFAAELLLTRDRQTGFVLLPRKVKRRDRTYYELGWVSSMIIGAIAALAILYFLPPTLSVNTPSGSTTTQYDVVKLVALSVLAGSAGRSVLSGAQSRLVAELNQQKAATTARLAKVQTQRMADGAAHDAQAAVHEAAAGKLDALAEASDPGQVQEIVAEIANSAASVVGESAVGRLKNVEQTVEAPEGAA